MGRLLLSKPLCFHVLLLLSSLPNTQAATCDTYREDECDGKMDGSCMCKFADGMCQKSEDCGDGIGVTEDPSATSAYLPIDSAPVVMLDEGFTVGAYKEDCGDAPTCFATTPSLELCEHQCTDHASCNSFAYCTGTRDPQFPRCYLKSKKVDFTLKSTDDCTTYKADGTRLGDADNLVARTEGVNLASYKADCTEDTMDNCFQTEPDWGFCHERCDHQDGCKSFAYCTGRGNADGKARCYLKTGDFTTMRHVGGDCTTYYPTAPAMCKDAKKWYKEQGCCGAPLKELNMNVAKPSGMQKF